MVEAITVSLTPSGEVPAHASRGKQLPISQCRRIRRAIGQRNARAANHAARARLLSADPTVPGRAASRSQGAQRSASGTPGETRTTMGRTRL